MTTQIEHELENAIKQSLKSYCETLADDNGKPSLLDPKLKVAQLEGEIWQEISAYKRMCAEGFKHCYDAVEAFSQIDPSIDFNAFKENVEKVKTKLRSKANIDRYTKQVALEKSWKELLELTDVTMQLLYKGAQQIFTVKRYPQAEAAFLFLSTIDSMQYAFWVGLGHARYYQAKFQEAISSYQMASLCDPFSVWPNFYSANCYEAQNDFDQALVCLEDAQNSYHQLDQRDPEMEEVISQRIEAIKQRG